MTAPLPMTPRRWAALLLGLPVALAIIGWMGLTAVAMAGQASFPVRLAVPVHGSTVSLSGGKANVHVTQAAGSELRLTGTAHYSLVRSTVTWHRTSSGVAVSPRCRFVTGVCSFDFRAVVPEGKRALISTGSGDVTLQGLSSPVSAGTGSGNVRAENIPSALTVRTGSGDISGGTLSGPRVTLKTGSGNVTVPTSSVSQHVITVHAGSGNISITN